MVPVCPSELCRWQRPVINSLFEKVVGEHTDFLKVKKDKSMIRVNIVILYYRRRVKEQKQKQLHYRFFAGYFLQPVDLLPFPSRLLCLHTELPHRKRGAKMEINIAIQRKFLQQKYQWDDNCTYQHNIWFQIVQLFKKGKEGIFHLIMTIMKLK